jgi:hypothetical protein
VLEVALSPAGATWSADSARGRADGAPAEAFAAALAAAPSPHRVRVTLCGNLVHYLALPWPDAVADEAEGATLAAHHFRRVFGEAAEGWAIRFDAEDAGVRLACAVEKELLEALQVAARAAGRRLDSVQPFLAAAFNGWRREFGKTRTLFVTLEPGRWCAAHLGGGDWRELRSGRLEGDEASALVGLIARETALAGDERLPVRVYAPAFPRLSEQIEGLGERVRLLRRPAEPLYASAAN